MQEIRHGFFSLGEFLKCSIDVLRSRTFLQGDLFATDLLSTLVDRDEHRGEVQYVKEALLSAPFVLKPQKEECVKKFQAILRMLEEKRKKKKPVATVSNSETPSSFQKRRKKQRVLQFFTSAFAFHVFILSPKGTVYCFGGNDYHNLGLGDQKTRKKVVKHPFFSINTKNEKYGEVKVTDIAIGNGHTIFLDKKNRLFSCGENTFGATAQREKKAHTIYPKLIPQFSLTRINSMFCGSVNSFFVDLRGVAYACGGNDYNQLGIFRRPGHGQRIFTPQRVLIHDQEIIQISPSRYYTLFLTESGLIYACGSNSNLGMGIMSTVVPLRLPFTGNGNVVQIACSFSCSFFLTSMNQIWGCGSGGGLAPAITDQQRVQRPRVLDLGKFVPTGVKCGWHHAIIETTDGFFGCGNPCGAWRGAVQGRHVGNLVDFLGIKRVVQFSVGINASFFITRDFDLYCFGCETGRRGRLLDSKDAEVVSRVGEKFMMEMKKELKEMALTDRGERLEYLGQLLKGLSSVFQYRIDF